MKRLYAIIGLLILTASAFGQAPNGRSITWDSRTTCDDPAPTRNILCLDDLGNILQSVKGLPYAAPINVGSFSFGLDVTITGAPGTAAAVENVGTPQAPKLRFTIPAGAPGGKGDKGDPGLAATIAAGAVTILPPGSPATVTNSGSTNAAIFNFGIPQPAPAFPSVTCDVTYTTLRGDGKGGGTVTITFDATKCH